MLIDQVNTGQMPRIRVANTARWPSTNITGGPLGTYRYRLLRVDIHYSMNESSGSEHSFDFQRLPMEVKNEAFQYRLKKIARHYKI